MKLVIVESPTKAKTLKTILDKSYEIKASNGHIRDLPKSGLGVDVANNYQPEYVVADKAKKTLKDLKKSIEDFDTIVLATDPDREGEAIAWHLKELLTPAKSKKATKERNFERVVFHELTKGAIEEAFNHPSTLDMHLVDAQQARRVLDRLVGYKLSPLLWKKVRFGLSAGRVQSVAVRLIVERERERSEFKPEEYWDIAGLFATKSEESFTANLTKKSGKTLKVVNGAQANEIDAELKGDNFHVKEVKKSERTRKPYAPFKTSTLQQAAANVYGMSAKKTMMAAQKLFEKGFITYHRTDSISLAPSFIESLRSYTMNTFGAQYLPSKAILYKTNSKNAQEAHEAIRPTDPERHPNVLKETEEKKIYTLIYKRTLESQMESAVYDQTAVVVESDKKYEFRANGSLIKFDGWLKVEEHLGFKDDENGLNVLPNVAENDAVSLAKLTMDQKFTLPPARYNDASLIKTLEELGIGRPSTYAPTISTILARSYVKREGRTFVPEDVAFVVTDLLIEHFPNVIDYEFTAGLEEDLDKIAANEKEWVPIIRAFYEPFEKILEQKDKELSKRDVTNLGQSDEVCPDCGKPLVFKLGKYGKFLSCSNYPECSFAKPLEENKVFDENGVEITDFGKCPNCETGTFMLKAGKFGKFLACNNYPKCKTTKPFLEKIGVKCPKCEEGDVIVKKAKGRIFYGCSRYPECDYSSWKKPGGPSAESQENGQEAEVQEEASE